MSVKNFRKTTRIFLSNLEGLLLINNTYKFWCIAEVDQEYLILDFAHFFAWDFFSLSLQFIFFYRFWKWNFCKSFPYVCEKHTKKFLAEPQNDAVTPPPPPSPPLVNCLYDGYNFGGRKVEKCSDFVPCPMLFTCLDGTCCNTTLEEIEDFFGGGVSKTDIYAMFAGKSEENLKKSWRKAEKLPFFATAAEIPPALQTLFSHFMRF